MIGGVDVSVLARIGVFAGLTAPQLEVLAHSYGDAVFGEGERILRRGLSGSGLYIVLDGEASVVLGGNEIARLGRGDFFGEVSSLLGRPPTADVVAAGLVRCLVIPGPEVERFLLDNPRVTLAMLRTEALRLADTLEWVG
jgi:CRP-like cAMP-binding protein